MNLPASIVDNVDPPASTSLQALNNSASAMHEKPTTCRAGRGPVPIPAKDLQLPPAPSTVPLATAHNQLQTLFGNLIVHHTPGATIIAASPGTGKTATLARVLCQLHDADSWPRVTDPDGRTRAIRVLYTAPTTAAVDAFVAATGGLAVAVAGRNADPNHPWGCHRASLANAVGAARRNVRSTVCFLCQKAHRSSGGQGFPCQYLASREATEGALLVAAPHARVFADAGFVAAFDVVVVDEALVPGLVEEIPVTTADLAQWRRAVGTRETGDPLRLLVEALHSVVTQHRPRKSDGWEPALPALRQHCPRLADLVAGIGKADLDGARLDCAGRIRLDRDPTRVPTRIAADLVTALATELDRPMGADTRVSLTPTGLELVLVREQLLETLRNRTLINLDATPSPAIEFFFSHVDRRDVAVPAAIQVTQTTDHLGTHDQLTAPDRRVLGRVEAAVEAITREANAPVVFSCKDLNPEADGPGPHLQVSNGAVRYGHFGKDERALNDYADADLLVVVGRHSPPIDRLRALVQTARFAAVPPPCDGPTRRLLAYEFRTADGDGMGRWSAADPDPDVERAVRAAEAATILQAIGRGRPVLRNAAWPLCVYLIGNLPIAGLPIDELTRLEKLGAPPTRRRTSPAFFKIREERNATQQADQRARVETALATLQETGRKITRSAVAREAVIHRSTLYANAEIKALVEAAIGRQTSITPVGASLDSIQVGNEAPTPAAA